MTVEKSVEANLPKTETVLSSRDRYNEQKIVFQSKSNEISNYSAIDSVKEKNYRLAFAVRVS